VFRIVGYFLPSAPEIFVYMLQQHEYNSRKFLLWLKSLPYLATTKKRNQLEKTARARLLLAAATSGWLVPLIVVVVGIGVGESFWLISLILLTPFLSVFFMLTINNVMAGLIVEPNQRKQIDRSSQRVADSSATRIAVLGSYGKTTMKDILETVLSAGLSVKATPGNKNVLISHARWVQNEVNSNEDVLIFEYGEARRGDINKLAKFSKPQISIVTGLAPAHMDGYPTLEAIGQDFTDILHFTDENKVYVNEESQELIKRFPEGRRYSLDGLGDWQVSHVEADISGLSFTLSKGRTKLELRSGLLGLHQVGPLVAACVIGLEELSMNTLEIISGVAKTKPFEHRLQPYKLGGAWIIDDSYNGNIEGIKAGLVFLSELKTTGHKIYVTPGLVDQGDMNERVHQLMGKTIAQAAPDRVVLMKNSVTKYIQVGLEEAGFHGELLIESNPLDFYTNLEHFVASGDIVLLQNDWPDSYS
jgi:UDP-N-acetylmuramoyl-tripeptide--D-alanyl-D-alanine ligase